jgi:anti-sigma factor RsiW
MECRDTEQLIDAQLDGDLDVATAAELDRHVAECAACRRRHGPLLTLLRRPDAVPESPDLQARVLAAVAEAANARHLDGGGRLSMPTRRRTAWAPWTGAVAASLCFFVMGWMASQWLHKGPPTVGNEPAAPEKPEASLTIVSPWIVSALAQALTGPVPEVYVPHLSQALVTEFVAPLPSDVRPAAQVRSAPASRPGKAPEPELPPRELLLLPALYRAMGV